MFKTHVTLKELKKCIEEDCCNPPVIEKTHMLEIIDRLSKLEEKLYV